MPVSRRRLTLVPPRPQPSSIPSCVSSKHTPTRPRSKVRLLEEPRSPRLTDEEARRLVYARWPTVMTAYTQLLEHDPHKALGLQDAVYTYLLQAAASRTGT